MSQEATNQILQALSLEALALLQPHLEPVDLPVRTILFDIQVAPRYVHFLLGGIASVVTNTATGQTVEVSLNGHEGFPEKLHLLGPSRGSTQCFMQMPGTALRMDFKLFHQIFRENEEIRSHVLRYVQYEALTLAQLSACNRLHQVEERLARWLLMVQDRVETTEIKITQEFLAEMLGAGRPTLNVAIKNLERAGLVRVVRASLVVLSRERLEAAACECYPIIHKLFDGLQD